MKKTLFTLTATTLVAVAFVVSCQSPTEKVAAAQENVQDAKQDLKLDQKNAAVAEQKMATAEEWKAFKTESETQITDNDKRIAILKSNMRNEGRTKDADYARRIDTLELRNKDLKYRMDTYDKGGKSNWETFKTEFKTDLDGLGQSLKNFTVKSKK